MTVEDKERGLQNNPQPFEHILALIQKDKSTRKRSRGPTRVRNLTSLTRILECITHPTKQPLVVDDGQTDENPHKPHTCIDDLVAKMPATLAKKKRTKKRNSLVTSVSSNTNEMQLDQRLVLYNHHLSSSNPLGTTINSFHVGLRTNLYILEEFTKAVLSNYINHLMQVLLWMHWLRNLSIWTSTGKAEN